VADNIGRRVITLVDWVAKPLIWISIAFLLFEIHLGAENSRQADAWWFLWVERLVAVIFIIEYFTRWAEDYFFPDNTYDIGLNGDTVYPLSLMGVIDLMAWLPFVVGFFVPVNMLGWIRALRILRILKYFRYDRRLQLMALGFYKAMEWLKMVWMMMIVVSLFSAVILFQVEPSMFDGKLHNAFWFSFVSATTVGYGDMSPETVVGKVTTIIILFMPAIAIFSSIVGIITSTINVILEAEKDPTINPIDEFFKEHARQTKLKKALSK
jgi:voltage-gated potassium channel